MMIALWRRSQIMLTSVESSVPDEIAERVRGRLGSLSLAGTLFVLAGFLYGGNQNRTLLWEISQGNTFTGFDISFMLSACVLWGVIALEFYWRVSVSLAFSQLGRVMELDLYRLDRARPLGRLATLDVLVVAGAMAFTPSSNTSTEVTFPLSNSRPHLLRGFAVCRPGRLASIS